jgi:hypothetical protein
MFLDRNSDGAICTLYAARQYADQEEVADTSEEILDFLHALKNPEPVDASSGDFKHALFDLGWYDAVDTAAKAAGGLTLILWNSASRFEKADPMVAAIAMAIGKTADDIDTLFRKTNSYRILS